jgi:hypothetical protein
MLKTTDTSLLLLVTITVLLLISLVPLLSVDAGEALDSGRELTSEPWDAGQRMFYADSLWRGGDCASSVDLGDGRILWLFADSYVGIKPPYVRDYCCVTMIRNCIGIQKGYDPSEADFSVYWHRVEGSSTAYFPGDDTSWFWPGNAVRIDSSLLVFLMHLCPSDSGLGFRECDGFPHAAFLVNYIGEDPLKWTITRLDLPEAPFGIMLGAATIVEPPYLYMFNVDVKEPGNRLIYLARWHTDSLMSGSATSLEWWTGNSPVWVPDLALTSKPTPVFEDGATEFSVIYDHKADQYLAIQTVGFGAANVMMRTAPGITGPWSDLRLVYEPPEKSDSDIMIYAAKAHPEITGADIIITYNTNGPIEKIIADTTLYYPRFVKINWLR